MSETNKEAQAAVPTEPTVTLPIVAEDNPENKTPEQQAKETEENDYLEQQRKKYEDLYNKRIVEGTGKQKVVLQLRKPTGQMIPDPLDDNKQIPEFKGWEPKEFKKTVISSNDFKIIEKLRGLWNKERAKEDIDVEKIADSMEKMYKYIAYAYLGMSAEEFSRADWEELRPVLDSCTFKTNFFVPNSSG